MEPGPQFQQLDMFKPAHELMDERRTMAADFHPSFLPPIPYATGWARKHAEAYREGLDADIHFNGISKPVEVIHGGTPDGRQMLNDGHHRVAVAGRRSPNYLVPVTHHDEASRAYDRMLRRRT